jgi:hypothetical protein
MTNKINEKGSDLHVALLPNKGIERDAPNITPLRPRHWQVRFGLKAGGSRNWPIREPPPPWHFPEQQARLRKPAADPDRPAR